MARCGAPLSVGCQKPAKNWIRGENDGTPPDVLLLVNHFLSGQPRTRRVLAKD